jgi:uncharacterized protein (DUF1501 family)
MASESDKVLVMIFLEGGNDGLNTVVPLDRLSELNSLRPHVILEESDLLPLQQSEVALHPSLGALKDLYNQNKLMVIQNVGYPEQNYSHFRSTDIWMSGSDSDQLVSSGWAGRHLEQTYRGFPETFPNDDMEDPLSVEIGFGASLLFQGVSSTMSMILNNVDSFYQLVDNEEQEAPDSNAGDQLKFVRLITKQSQLYGERVIEVASKVNNHVNYPVNNYLADQLKVVSKLIAGGSRTPLYLVRLGGFDTHDAQVLSGNHSQGEHANLLRMLNDAINAFVKDLEYHGTEDKVLGMTFSEFGRRIVSNASFGTDHGAAAPMFFFGNGIKGGVNGANPLIDRQMTYDDNLSWEFDFRQLYGSVLEQWFGTSSEMRSNVLFKDFNTVEIIGEGTVLGNEPQLSSDLFVYPNPLNGQATIQFESDNTPINIELVDLQGKRISIIYSGTLGSRNNSISWNTSRLNPGRYFVVLRSQKKNQVFSVVK